MATVERIPKTYADAVTALAEWQGSAGPSDLAIYSYDDPKQEVVRFVHISDEYPNLGGVRVYRLGRSEDFPFRSAVAMVNQEQWAKICRRDSVSLLPEDWITAEPKRVWPHG